MKLVHPNIEQQIIFEENQIPMIIVENQRCFTLFAESFSEQINGEKGSFVLSHDNEPLEINKKMIFIPTLVPFDINSRTHINKLYQRLKEVANSDNNYIETQTIIQSLERYIYSIENDLSFDITLAKEFDITNIFKGFSIQFSSQGDVVEKLIDYIQITNELIGERIYVIINLRSFVSDTDTELFYQTILAKKYRVLLLESSIHKALPCEKRIIIDKDLCEF